MDGGRLAWLAQFTSAVAWRRRLLAGGLAAASVALVIHAVEPAGPPTVPVIVTARDLPGGTVLAAGDLRIAEVLAGSVPDGAVAGVDDATGRLLAGPARAGEPVTDVRLLGPALLDGWGDDLVAVPVRIADPGVVAILQPGDRVDLLAASPDGFGGAVRVATGVPLLAVLPPAEAGLLADGALVVVAVEPGLAATLAEAATVSRLSVALRR